MPLARRALIIALIATACTAESPARTDSTGVAEGPPGADPSSESIGGATRPTDTTSPGSGSSNPPGKPIPAPWTVTEFGIGPLRAGMTVPEAARMVGGSFAAPSSGAKSCTYAVWREAPEGVLVMLDKGLVARVDITRSSVVATSRGARIGDSEARIKDLYKGRVVVSPHEYTDGHYLTVTPPAGSGEDRSYRLVFETDGNRVTLYRAGKLPNVEWVEGCS